MRMLDGCASRKFTIKLVLMLAVLLIPFLLSGLAISQSVNNDNLSWKSYAASSGNSYIIAGGFRYFDVVLDREVEKVSIVAYHGESMPDSEDRSTSNYYRWEYDNGEWRDVSGYDSEYIGSSRCLKEDYTYKFFIGIDKKAKQGQWKIVIHVDDEAEETSFNIEVVTQLNFFLISLIGIYEPDFRDKRSAIDIDFALSDKKRIMADLKESVEERVDEILNKQRSSDGKKNSEDRTDIFIFDKAPPIKYEIEKSTVFTYPKSKLKTETQKSAKTFVFSNKGDGNNVFRSTKSISYKKIFVFVLSVILLSVAFVPAISTRDTIESSETMGTQPDSSTEEVDLTDPEILDDTASDSVDTDDVVTDNSQQDINDPSPAEEDIVDDASTEDQIIPIEIVDTQNESLIEEPISTNTTTEPEDTTQQEVVIIPDDNMSTNVTVGPENITDHNSSIDRNQTNVSSTSNDNATQEEITDDVLTQDPIIIDDQQIPDEKAEDSFIKGPGVDKDKKYFIHKEAPGKSFGARSIKEVNWESFWELFNDNSGWSLESYDIDSSEWTNIDQYLVVDKDRHVDNSSEKVSLGFLAPHTTDYQLTYSINIPVKSYVDNSDNYEYTLIYQINETEDYSVFYNWSDMVALPESLIFEHGMRTVSDEDYFYFKVSTGDTNNPADDILAGTDVLLDPVFGYTGTGANSIDGDQIPGGYFQMGSVTGVANSITAYFQTAGGDNSGRAAIYDSGYNLVTNGVSNQNTSVGDGWVEFGYTTSPTLNANAWYFLVVFTNSAKSDLQYTTSGGSGLYNDDGWTYPNFPSTYAANPINSGYLVSIYCTYTEIDSDPPTPDPLTWSVEPYNVTSSSITMIATTASDVNLPITYYFNETTGNPGGTDGTWQESTTYTDDSLSENTQYGYEVKARDNYGTPNEGSYSNPISYEYTSVDPPTDGELSFEIGTTWINASVAQPPNPTSGSTASYFNWITGGAINSGWLSGLYYHNRTSLPENTNYGAQVRYRNADAEATTYNPTEKTNYTLLEPPTDEELTLTSGVNWVNSSVSLPTNPTTGSTGSYFNWITGGAANSGWQSGVYYHNRTSLTENTEYGSQVRYQNAEEEPTSYNPTEETKYTLCAPPTDGEFTIDGHGVNWINMSVAHPTNPLSDLTSAYFEVVTGVALDSGWVTDSESGRYYYNATGLAGGTTYGFRVKYRNGEGIETTYTSEKQDTTDEGAALPTVITNASSWVEETNATLHGWLQNNGSADTTCYFLWDTVNPPAANNVSQGIIPNNANFSYDTKDMGLLTKGTLYYFDTKAVNSEGWYESGGVNQFLTKPDPLTSFTATVVSNTQVDLSWTDGTGGDGAYIEYSVGSAPSPWNEEDGTPIDADGNVTTPHSHTSLASGYHYYYKAWAYASDGGWLSSGNKSAPRGDDPQIADVIVPAMSIVVTNESEGIEETNATLRGYLQYNGSVDTECFFLWDTVSPPVANNVSQGIIANNTEFGYDTSGAGLLTKATLYFFDTKANNSGGWDESGGLKMFLTKPDEPNSLTVQANTSTSDIYLTWNIGMGANTTYVERNTATSWALGEGVEVYNGSGTNYEDADLPEGITYYYQAWSFANWTYGPTTLYHFSDINDSASATTNIIPTISDEVPANESVDVVIPVQLSITVNHAAGDSMAITWYSNSSGSWIPFGTNATGVDGNGTYYQTNDNFTDYTKTYYWNVSVTDGSDINDSAIFNFTTEGFFTSVDPIDPYTVLSSGQKEITASGGSFLDNVTLYYRWSEDNDSWDSWNMLSYDDFEDASGDPWTGTNYTDGGADCILYTGGTYAYQGHGSNAAQIQDDVGDTSSFYTTTPIDVDTPGYELIRVDFWFYANGMANGHDFFLEYFDGSTWQQPKVYVAGTDFINGQFYHEVVWINESEYTYPTNMQIKFRCDALNNNQQVYIDEIYVNTTTQTSAGNGINWTEWSDLSNPDTVFEWGWTFNFPNGAGYYEFYSIGKKSGSPDETPPSIADAICYFRYALLVINSYDLVNDTGSKLNNVTGSLNVNNEYVFQINITDEQGWDFVDYINITTWYDNGSDATIYNQSNNLGGNLNMFLQYDNTSGTAAYRMHWPDDEAQIILANCAETIINSTTRIVNISFIPLNQVRWGGGDGAWDTAQNATNDLNSWNFNISVAGSGERKGYVIDEYGVHKFTNISPSDNWVDVVASPGFSDSSNIVTITYSSNYDFNITIYFEEDLTNTSWGKSILIENNVDVLASADSGDDITTDITFTGIGENNAVDIINDSGVFYNDSVSQTVNVQFDVYIPLGTFGGIYTSRVATKIFQK